jgi:BirA family biotin operon repressor/biotin-[acetyl-CoA-carboxylase] ligase
VPVIPSPDVDRGSAWPASDRRPLDRDALCADLLLPVGPLSRLGIVAETGSTNADLAAALTVHPEDWPDLSVLIAEHQEAGHGRVGRSWETPARAAVTLSVVLRPIGVPDAAFGWLPLLAGTATAAAIREVSQLRAVVKWPNDVLVEPPGLAELEGWGRRRKVAGILAEVVATPTGPVVIVGIGINVSQTASELPVESAISLAMAAPVPTSRDALIRVLLQSVGERYLRWSAARGDAGESGIAAEIATACATLGERVTIDRPGGKTLIGVAESLSGSGALRVVDDAGAVHEVLAGDVRQVRVG